MGRLRATRGGEKSRSVGQNTAPPRILTRQHNQPVLDVVTYFKVGPTIILNQGDASASSSMCRTESDPPSARPTRLTAATTILIPRLMIIPFLPSFLLPRGVKSAVNSPAGGSPRCRWAATKVSRCRTPCSCSRPTAVATRTQRSPRATTMADGGGVDPAQEATAFYSPGALAPVVAATAAPNGGADRTAKHSPPSGKVVVRRSGLSATTMAAVGLPPRGP